MTNFNDTFVVVDAQAGLLTRFQTGGSKPRITHLAEAPGGGPVTFTADIVEVFRLAPPSELAAEAQPTSSPPDTVDTSGIA